ncbi:hypothetical protein ACFFKC_20820 [Pseudoduganella danionis]|uniref:Lipoprotein n=2 Tax=Pseudoduganella danionis TaxID=1890295 RepID=A0ABW9SS75_9BURK|nr:hypothetical protein [Pseudoduganella danionis]
MNQTPNPNMRLPHAMVVALSFLLGGCANTSSYPDFNAKLDMAVGKINEQVALPLDLPLKSASLDELVIVEYSYLRPVYCRWQFYYDGSGHIVKWAYPDDLARRECDTLAFHIR